MKLTYRFTDVKAMLIVASEIENETGLIPELMETNTETLSYNPGHITLCHAGEMTVEEYISKNQKPKNE